MAKKTPSAKGAASRERLLEAAAQVLSEKGYAGTRLSDVAKIAGVQVPALYYYFESREQLIAEVLRQGQRALIENVTNAVDELPLDSTAVERLDTAVRVHMVTQLRLSAFATAVARNANHAPPEVQKDLEPKGREYLDFWDKLVREAGEEPRSEFDVRVTRMLLIGALNSAVDWYRPARGTLEALIHSAQTAVRRMVGCAEDAAPPAAVGVESAALGA
ncbi:TetR/AcrR family transcriptional regulator [Granulicoccus phenolivorans]|uniref:TetR/AcrR family transcriptional regulator n=1 Tax=Granulicoccus phenolivorans TaxID=266854 RepID=UPI00138AF519|nr:TetR/AcrR family transcriptional regulator [Granulicoccus phenolivorans]